MLQCRCLPDFEATIHNDGCLEFSDAYTQLEDVFLEPVRMTECDLLEFDKDIRKDLLHRPSSSKLFLRDEFDTNLYNMSVYFADYGILENPLYLEITKLTDDVFTVSMTTSRLPYQKAISEKSAINTHHWCSTRK